MYLCCFLKMSVCFTHSPQTNPLGITTTTTITTSITTTSTTIGTTATTVIITIVIVIIIITIVIAAQETRKHPRRAALLRAPTFKRGPTLARGLEVLYSMAWYSVV